LAAVVMTAISMLIIPGFREMFDDFDLQLPAFSQLILNLSNWLNRGGFVVIAAIMVVAIGLYFGWGYLPWSLRNWLNARFKLPFGRSRAIARSTRYTADLLEAGLTVPDAVRIAGSLTHHAARQEDWPMTATVRHAVRADMPIASRIRLLKEISQSYAERARVRLSWARGIVEPVAIIFIGILVGAIVIALFSPLVKLVEALSM
jgi:type IV pilus assembly protein PilC